MSPRRMDFDKPATAPVAEPVTIMPMVETTSPTTTAVVPHVTQVQTTSVARPTNRLTMDQVDKYGVSATAAIGQVSENLLKTARAGDIDVIGKDLGNLLVAAQKYDPKNLGKGGLFQWGKLSIQRMRNNFDTVHTMVETLSKKADGNISLFSNRIGDLAKLYEGVKANYYALDKEIDELEARIASEEAYPPEVDQNDPFSANEFQKWQSTVSFATKRLHEMRLQQTLAQQNAQTITQMAVNASALVRKFGEVKDFTIPQLKMSFNLAIQNIEQAKGADLATDIDALNNKTIIENAKMLGSNTVKIQTALTRTSVELTTLQFNQEAILTAMSETKRIHEEMATRIAAERPQIEALNKQLATIQTSR